MIKHTKVSTKPAAADASKIGGPDWNDEHQIDDAAALTAALNNFSTTLKGLVPASTASARYLKGDGSWSDSATLTSFLANFTTSLAGTVPASGAAARYLKGDGSWSDSATLTSFLANFTTSLAGTVPASGGGTVNFLRADGQWTNPIITIGQFGDGSDGAFTFDGTTTNSAYTLTNPGASGVYAANRETFFTDMTVNVGITVTHHGFPLNVKGTLTNNGNINWNGASAVGTTGGVANPVSGPVLPVGPAGGNGGAANTNGSNGGTSNACPRGFSTTSASGGTGGAPPSAATAGGTCHGGGGGGSLANGGFGGNLGVLSGHGDWHTLGVATTARTYDDTSMTAGTGGGGGGGGGGAGVGGGGGASASWGVMRVFKFNPAATGIFRALGGNGGTRVDATGVNQPGSGGGGGGGGGLIVLVTGDQSPPINAANQATVCAGGTGSSGGPGTGTGSAGSAGANGGSGLVQVFN